MLNAPPPKKAGIISGLNVLYQPKDRNNIKLGIRIICEGNIMVDSITINAISLPGHFNFAKEYATSEEESKTPVITEKVIKRVFLVYFKNGIACVDK